MHEPRQLRKMRKKIQLKLSSLSLCALIFNTFDHIELNLNFTFEGHLVPQSGRTRYKTYNKDET